MPSTAKAQSTPKPAPGSPESIRRQVDDIETARTLLKAVKVVEREPTEPKKESAVSRDAEGAIYDVKVWASTAWLLWQETRWSAQLTKEDGLAMSRIDRLIEKVNGAAEELYNEYTGEGR